jgi:dTDP-4-amino-4,6-dideoxygalactose transaminase
MIPFNRPTRVDGTERAVAEVLQGDEWSADGPFTRRCSELLGGRFDGAAIVMTSSCSAALEMTGLLLGLGPGDEVIVPTFTFPTTAAAYALRGARPIFADIDPHTLVLDLDHVEELISPATKAVVVVHYGGVSPAMDRLASIVDAHDLSLVEDLAHGPFARWRGRPLGSFGRLATLSFHETKNFTCGEGGALVVNDESLVEPAEVLRDKGTDRQRVERGEASRYSWVAGASNYGLAEPLAAILATQLEQADTVQRRRAAIWERYRDGLGEWADAHGVRLPEVPDGAAISHHLFHLVLPSKANRDELITALRRDGIHAVFHYTPLHASPMGQSLGGKVGQCPVAEDVSDRLVRLPFSTGLEPDDQARVLDAVRALDW